MFQRYKIDWEVNRDLMKSIKFFDDQVVVNNKLVILRLDLNVPIKDKKIQDFTRIDVCR